MLGPVLFVIFINDLPSQCANMSELYMFADDAKLYKHICCVRDSVDLNASCQELFNWCENWQMSININKCKVLTVSHDKNSITRYDYGFQTTPTNFVSLEHVENFCDLGVVMDSELKFDKHI